MSYLSATENVGFSGIPQNISDASCATQYKMAVNGLEGVPGNCAETMYIPDCPGDDQTYISHLNDNYYTKFKIDPNELYTFHDSDVSEITVSHTEDAFIFSESVDTKPKDICSPSKEIEIVGAFTNGDVKKEIKKKVLSNGHYNSVTKKPTQKDVKTSYTKVQKTKSQVKDVRRESVGEVHILSVQSPNTQGTTTNMSPPSTVPSINSVNTNNVPTVQSKQASTETFLDVFKREQGLVENSVVKTEPLAPPPPPPLMKIPLSPQKKISSGKTPSQSKPRRGRGPAMHEALQRISQRRAVAVPIKRWHAPDAFDCGPMSVKKPAYRTVDSSSEDDDIEMPEIEIGSRPLCIEEIAAESRNARIAFRKAAMRRQLHRAHETLRLAKRHSGAKALLNIVKKQLNGTSGLPTQTVNHLLAMRGMPSLLTSEERRTLRDSGWSGGESGSCAITDICSEESCTKPSLPCGRYCLAHITLASEQRLYASCAAVFAVGSRCNYPLLPLKDQLPLCEEHAWKRDNYDKLIRDNKPKKVIRPRLLAAPRRQKRRRRPPPPPRICPPAPPPALSQSLSEINVCPNSPAYESADDSQIGVMSENEYISASNSHELEVEVVHDILDPSVLSQMPDEAFTEFFNQGIVLEESGTFGEGSELAAALEAVLDERGLDERALDERELDGRELVDGELEEQVIEDETLHTMDDSMFADSPDACVEKIKMDVSTSVSTEISTNASS